MSATQTAEERGLPLAQLRELGRRRLREREERERLETERRQEALIGAVREDLDQHSPGLSLLADVPELELRQWRVLVEIRPPGESLPLAARYLWTPGRGWQRDCYGPGDGGPRIWAVADPDGELWAECDSLAEALALAQEWRLGRLAEQAEAERLAGF